MALGGGTTGASIALAVGGVRRNTAWLFGEMQGVYVVTTNTPPAVTLSASAAGVPCEWIGSTGGDSLYLTNDEDLEERAWTIPLADLRRAHEGFFPKLMGADAAPA